KEFISRLLIDLESFGKFSRPRLSMTKRLTLLIGFLLLIISPLAAQSAYAPMDRDYYHLIDRYAIIQGEIDPRYHSTFKPYRRSLISSWVDELEKENLMPRDIDRFN